MRRRSKGGNSCPNDTDYPTTASDITMEPEIELHVHPGVVHSWDHFCKTHPPNSIAIDGYVDGPAAFDASGPFANFDHHSGVNRLATRSTCGQILIAVPLGLFETFQVDGHPRANLFVNDCDQDVCVAYWLLCHAHRLREFTIEHDLAKLILVEDVLDATAGAYPFPPATPHIQMQAWVFELYEEARVSGRIFSMSAPEMKQLIQDTAERLTMVANGSGQRRELMGEYEVLGGGSRWKMIRESGTFARTKLFADGVRAFVAVRGEQDNRFHYTVGRMSPFVPFPLAVLFQRLNEVEGKRACEDRWNGSDTIGGSPRLTGSGLSPVEVERIVNEVLGEDSPRSTLIT